MADIDDRLRQLRDAAMRATFTDDTAAAAVLWSRVERLERGQPDLELVPQAR